MSVHIVGVYYVILSQCTVQKTMVHFLTH